MIERHVTVGLVTSPEGRVGTQSLGARWI